MLTKTAQEFLENYAQLEGPLETSLTIRLTGLVWTVEVSESSAYGPTDAVGTGPSLSDAIDDLLTHL